jgi:hypothetical protein
MAKNGFTAVSYNMFAASLGSNTIPWLVPKAFVSHTVTCCDSKFAWKYRWCCRSNVEVVFWDCFCSEMCFASGWVAQFG